MRSSSATHNLTAISATNSESAINVLNSVDLSILSEASDIINLSPRREDNRDEANGKEEPDEVYDNGYTAEGTLNHTHAQPQHFAYLFGFGLGNVATAAAGAGYEHTITPIARGVDQARDLPSFTLLSKLGDTILKRRLASVFVDQVTATFAADQWVKISGNFKGTGKHTQNVIEEEVDAAGNTTTLTLAANGVEGSTAAERLDSVHRIKVELAAGVWTEVDFTAVSSATPAEITITDPGGDITVVTYKVLYVPTEGAEFTFPARVKESNLRVAEMSFNFGGTWNGTAFEGGRPMGAELRQITCELSNNSTVSFVPGGGGSYGSMHERGGRLQKLKVDRRFRDYIFQQHINANDTFGVYIKCVGEEFDTGHNYQVEIIYPKVGLLTSPISVSDKKLTEAGDFIVMEDATYGSVIVKVKNMWAGYAQ
ncbi:hypothetical protein [Desulforhopalus singaporensis]|uniref:Uncharacterized protein n=1 Tax=Desulforhopalus singaporensis TaxID=91360 RepID=A0A1H0VHR8_9BACT|nr:hypothetical protein [Desulforhopalus singaporensis]SDP78047.1 hypothetical protein SAMN05660330_04081 [Desulforhopalus singaporensis]